MSAVELRMNITGIQDARRALKDVNNDTEALKRKFKEFGLDARDSKLLIQQLNKELNQSRREALGLVQNTKPLSSHIRDGVIQAGLLGKAIDGARKSFETMRKLSGVPGMEEGLENAIKLDDKFEELREKLRGSGDELRDWKGVIKDISNATGQSQEKLIEGVLKAQEARSAGRDILGGGGAMLYQFARQSFSDRAPVEDTIKSSIDLMQDLKLKPEELPKAAGLIRAGEEAGAITAKQINTQFGGTTVSLAQKRGTSGLQALREGAALAQVIGSAPGIAGNADMAQNRLENFLNKIIDKEQVKRIQKTTGVNVLDAKTGTLRPVAEIMEAIGAKETTETAAGRGGKFQISMANMFRDAQAREGFMALYRERAKIRQMEALNPETGAAIFDANYNTRQGSLGATLERNKIRTSNEFYTRLPTIAPTVKNTSDLMSKIEEEVAAHPLGALMASALAGPAAGAVAGAGVRAAAPQLLKTAGQTVGKRAGLGLIPGLGTVLGLLDASDAGSGSGGKVSAPTAAGDREFLLRQGIKVNSPSIEVNVPVYISGEVKAQVDKGAVSSKVKAQGGGGRPAAPGRG